VRGLDLKFSLQASALFSLVVLKFANIRVAVVIMIGTKLAHYEITSHLGTGGMGEVYQATDSKLGRSVAIKLLPETFASDADRAARFEREARVLASLNHPNIAAIHGLEADSGRTFLVMELVPGETLAERIQRGPIPVDETLTFAKHIVDLSRHRLSERATTSKIADDTTSGFSRGRK
jgi:serine/threonine protein kinase